MVHLRSGQTSCLCPNRWLMDRKDVATVLHVLCCSGCCCFFVFSLFLGHKNEWKLMAFIVIITTISNENFLFSSSHFSLLYRPSCVKKKRFSGFISFSWILERTGRREKERSPSFPIRNPPSNKKKINSLKMWTLERLAPGTQSNSKTRKEKETRQENKTKKKREKWIWGERKEGKKKKHLKVNRVAREREIQNCGNKNPRKKSEEQPV